MYTTSDKTILCPSKQGTVQKFSIPASHDNNALLLDMSIFDTRILLCNLYAPTQSQNRNFFKDVKSKIENIAIENFFILGDLNSIIILIIPWRESHYLFGNFRIFGFFCSSFSNFFCWVLISSVLTTILKASRQKWSILPRRGSNSCSWFEGRPW